jgi:hypothetical protein
MSVLRSLEDKLSGLVEGTFGRVFKSEVRPVELARKLAKEMDAHRTHSVSRTYVPNEYVVWLSPEDRARYDGVEAEVIDELAAYLLEHARRERLVLVGVPRISFETEESLRLGEFGIQARTVKVEADAPRQSEPAHTMIYSADAPAGQPSTTAALVLRNRRVELPPTGGVVGRSRECDVVLDDGNVSRRHAEIVSTGPGSWAISDLGSTNGVRVNGHRVEGRRSLAHGDRIEFGTLDATFEAR